MGEYEELVELGIEGVDRVVDKYHDKAFDKVGKHSPAWHRRHDRQQPQQQQRQQQQQQQQQERYRQPPASESSRADYEASRARDDSNSKPGMYSPNGRQEREYQDRDRRDSRHVSGENFYPRGPDAGAIAMRDNDPYNNARGYEVSQYQQPQYDDRRDDYEQRARPAPQRRRSSWSPQRSGRGRDGSRRSRSRSRPRSVDKTHRIAATVAGGLIGGLLGNQIQKGKKYDTAATIAGAVIGGIGAKEASEQWNKRKSKREDCDEKWDEKYGDEKDRRRDDRRRDDRYDRNDDDRYDRHDDGRYGRHNDDRRRY